MCEKEIKIFISYAHPNNNENWISITISKIKKYLEVTFPGRRVNFFYDKEDIQGNENISKKLVSNINDSDAMLVFSSKAYYASFWCMGELKHFCEKLQKQEIKEGIFLSKLDNSKPPDDLKRECDFIVKINGYTFFEYDAEIEVYYLYGSPADPICDKKEQSSKYIRLIYKLASDLSDYFEIVSQKTKSTKHELKPGEKNKKIFLIIEPYDPFIKERITSVLNGRHYGYFVYRNLDIKNFMLELMNCSGLIIFLHENAEKDMSFFKKHKKYIKQREFEYIAHNLSENIDLNSYVNYKQAINFNSDSMNSGLSEMLNSLEKED